VALTSACEAVAERDTALQLEKAGIRMAALLNRGLGSRGDESGGDLM
jgi:hypothetical protein